MNHEPPIYGLLAGFESGEGLVEAVRRAREEGYRKLDAYTPFPVDGLSEAMGEPTNAVPAIVLLGGILGGVGGFLFQYWVSAIDYPLNIGGRPLNSWPAFIPVTFELTVLTAALFGLVGMLALNGLPRPYHPVFAAPGFERFTRDRFFLCIEATDPKFDAAGTHAFLAGLEPSELVEVPS